MAAKNPAPFSTQAQAEHYDQRFAKLAPMRDAAHLLIAATLSDLPADARILSVGAGTGAEILPLAARFPGWRFTAVDPSGPMLDVCRTRTAAFADRCTYHHGYLDTLPAAREYHAATSILVSQFLTDPAERIDYFRTIAAHLRPGGTLIVSDLSTGPGGAVGDALIEDWMRLMLLADQTPEQIANLRTAYQTHVAILPAREIALLLTRAGFEAPIPFLQTSLIHAWHTRLAE